MCGYHDYGSEADDGKYAALDGSLRRYIVWVLVPSLTVQPQTQRHMENEVPPSNAERVGRENFEALAHQIHSNEVGFASVSGEEAGSRPHLPNDDSR